MHETIHHVDHHHHHASLLYVIIIIILLCFALLCLSIIDSRFLSKAFFRISVLHHIIVDITIFQNSEKKAYLVGKMNISSSLKVHYRYGYNSRAYECDFDNTLHLHNA